MRSNFILLVLVLLVFACVEPFYPDVSQEELQLLVVDGYINVGPGATTIRLSEVRPLTETVNYSELHGAIVQVIDNEQTHYKLEETIKGTYTAELNLPEDRTYKLSVLLPNEKHYESSILVPKLTPPIDSLWWTVDEVVNIHVASHDALALSKYYLWTFSENWQFGSPIPAVYKWENDTLQFLTVAEREAMKTCYKSFTSQGYQLGTSAAFNSDNITRVVTSIPIGSQRTSVKYAVTVTQRTLTEDEFNYQQLMNKNTDAVGSFFDPLPSELYGNIYCTSDPDELAVGYIGAYSTAHARLFILNTELPPAPVQDQCLSTVVLWADKASLGSALTDYAPTGMFEAQGDYYVSLMQRSCMDCRLYGTEPRPEFWD